MAARRSRWWPFQLTAARRRLDSCSTPRQYLKTFQLTAARRRLVRSVLSTNSRCNVSTHSRPKAAGLGSEFEPPPSSVSTHSRPKAAGRKQSFLGRGYGVSTHSRPKAAGLLIVVMASLNAFQLTAARRRLARGDNRAAGHTSFNSQPPEGGWGLSASFAGIYWRFNSQPPEGGWSRGTPASSSSFGFNSQPPEGGWCLR